MTLPPKSQAGRRADMVLEELARDIPWDLNKHLKGCLHAYQQKPEYGRAVFFALEAITGIGQDVLRKIERDGIAQELQDPEWGLSPMAPVSVPWMWVRALTVAWARHRAGEPIEKAFGFKGAQGTRPVAVQLDHLLDQRAVAVWTWNRILSLREVGPKRGTVEQALGEAEEHFGLSIDRIRAIWKKHGPAAKGAPHK